MADAIDLCNTCLYIAGHLDGDLSLLALANQVGLSRFRFHRVFKAWAGETLHDYVTRLRMEHAALALSYPLPRSPHRNVKAIALASGYQSLSSFSHAFSAYVGLSPRQYRYRMVNERTRRAHHAASRLSPYPALPVGGRACFAGLSAVVHDEPAREVVMVSTRMRGDATQPNVEAVEGAYGLERITRLFARARGVGRAGAAIVEQRLVAVEALANQRETQNAKRCVVPLPAGRYLVLSGTTSVSALYRTVRRNLDLWFLEHCEAPRADSLFVRYRGPVPVDAKQSVSLTLHIPLVALPTSTKETPRTASALLSR